MNEKAIANATREELEIAFRLQRKKMLDAMSAFAMLVRALPGGTAVVEQLEAQAQPPMNDFAVYNEWLKAQQAKSSVPPLQAIAKQFTTELEKQNLHERTVLRIIEGVTKELRPQLAIVPQVNSIDQRLKAVLDYDDQQMVRMSRPAYLKNGQWHTVADATIVRLAEKYVTTDGEDDETLEQTYKELEAAVTFRIAVIAKEQSEVMGRNVALGAYHNAMSAAVEGPFIQEGELARPAVDPNPIGDKGDS